MNGESACVFDGLTDEELVLEVRRGNKKALNALAVRYADFKGCGAAGYLDGDDLHQEAMIGLLSAVRSYSPDKGVPFRAFAAICANNSITSARRRTKNDFPPTDDTDEPAGTVPSSGNPLDSIVAKERFSTLLCACESVLSDVEKSAVFCRMSGLSYEETGEKLGLSAKAVDNAIQRARRKLKDAIAD